METSADGGGLVLCSVGHYASQSEWKRGQKMHARLKEVSIGVNKTGQKVAGQGKLAKDIERFFLFGRGRTSASFRQEVCSARKRSMRLRSQVEAGLRRDV